MFFEENGKINKQILFVCKYDNENIMFTSKQKLYFYNILENKEMFIIKKKIIHPFVGIIKKDIAILSELKHASIVKINIQKKQINVMYLIEKRIFFFFPLTKSRILINSTQELFVVDIKQKFKKIFLEKRQDSKINCIQSNNDTLLLIQNCILSFINISIYENIKNIKTKIKKTEIFKQIEKNKLFCIYDSNLCIYNFVTFQVETILITNCLFVFDTIINLQKKFILFSKYNRKVFLIDENYKMKKIEYKISFYKNIIKLNDYILLENRNKYIKINKIKNNF